MDRQGEKFVLDYLSIYYFYEEADFRQKRQDAEKILEHIKEYSRYQEGDVAFTISKFGNISEGHTLKEVEVVIPSEGDVVWVKGEKRHLDLQFKMETKALEDHVRIATRLIENGESISCLMYVNYKQDKAFLEALEKLKER
ncbi:MAG: hypothetical protein RR448_09080 [Niameybacter sp.]|uniref:hypothetical protein n=1 Tax=Niameybacter sp. TaxID=2033640 RepID=UPI002FCCB4A3